MAVAFSGCSSTLGDVIGVAGSSFRIAKVRMLLALLASASLLAASCSGGEEQVTSDSTSTVPEQTEATAVAEVTETTANITTTTFAPTATEPVSVGPVEYLPAAFDPPVGEAPGEMLFFDDRAAYWYRDGEFTEVGEGPFYEVVDDGAGGILFQRDQWESQTIWWLPTGATLPRDLLVTSNSAYLLLEGLIGAGAEREIVYQKRVNGDVETATATLRTYRISDAAVSELDVTGGWEWGTDISSIADGVAVGDWGAEGSAGFYWFDLALRESLIAAEFSENDAWAKGPPAQAMTIDAGQILSIGYMYEEQMRLVRSDQNSSISEVIATFPLAEGNWYATGLMVIANQAVISRVSITDDSDQHGITLGPVVVDLATGEATTLPYAVNARPLAGI
ncbi:MAG: hypothetical protein ACC652_11785 [Acidimicrobiales bacterium]